MDAKILDMTERIDHTNGIVDIKLLMSRDDALKLLEVLEYNISKTELDITAIKSILGEVTPIYEGKTVTFNVDGLGFKARVKEEDE